MASQSQFEEKAYIALLGLAEHFRTTKNIRKSIQCLEAVCVYIFFSLIACADWIKLSFFSFSAFSVSSPLEKGRSTYTFADWTDASRLHEQHGSRSFALGQGLEPVECSAARIRWHQIRCSAHTLTAVFTAKSVKCSETHTEESAGAVAEQYLLALKIAVHDRCKLLLLLIVKTTNELIVDFPSSSNFMQTTKSTASPRNSLPSASS